jgi:hypothetical protein
MFFHEVMSFSAQLIVMQHGYETVTKGLYLVWPYLSRVLPKHGIELTRQVVDRKPLEVPVDDLERGDNLLARLFQTVLDRRSSAQGERPDISARVQTARPAPAKKRAPARRRAPSGRGATATPRRAGKFRPRVISSDTAEA